MPKLKNRNLINYFLNLSNKLSEINQFVTFPNPSVGAVLTNQENISYSYTGKNGSPHAEYKLLKNQKNIINGNLFTSLEPCCHKGKNPPCTDIIINKKIKKIYTTNKDYDSRVINKTKKILKKNNIKIFYKKIKNESSRLHNFSSTHKIPYVVAKIALSKDGYTKHKSKRLFTSELALKFAHLKRYQSDSILIGKNTLNDDNPRLNSRVDGLNKTISKFIINPKLEFNSINLKNQHLRNSYVFHGSKDIKKIKKFSKKFKLFYFNFKTHLPCLDILKKIYNLGHKKILIEGGINTLHRFIRSNLVNELYIIRNNQKFGKHGMLKGTSVLKNKNLFLDETITLEDDSILIYKPKYVYRDNSEYF